MNVNQKTHDQIFKKFYWTLWLSLIGIAIYSTPTAAQAISTNSQVTAPQHARGNATAFTAVVGGEEHTCGLTTGGGVACWGDNADGQAGDGTDFPFRPVVAVVGLASGVQSVAVGGGHTCALLISGSVSCWGRNSNGQLGDGSTGERRAPIAVSGLAESVTAIAAGGGHTCALLQSGGVACWGRNSAGQLGNGATTDQRTPVAVTGLAGVVSTLAAGANHTCALLQSGAIQCWGDNTNGQLGDGATVSRPTPAPVIGLVAAATALAAGTNHTCAILVDGRVQCWGDNARGQLGDGSREDHPTAVLIRNVSDTIVRVTAGNFHTCALAADGDLYCWGTNNRGQLGNGTMESSRTPLRVPGTPGDATALGAGVDHTCAIFKAGAVYCWGSNRARQLGQDAPGIATIPRFIQPAAQENGVAPVNGLPAIAGGRYHTCLITPSRGVQCWGRNSNGQVGDGTQLPHSRPINVSGLSSGVTALALGAEHTCALLQHGGVQCWGSNQFGQLGDGATTERLTPTAVIGLAGAVAALVAGDSHTCALVQPGGVKCWGANSAGQLGDGTTMPSAFPVAVAGLSSGVVALTAGAEHSCALLQSGGVKCWGANLVGQLGDGSQLNRATPVDVLGLSSGVIALDAGGAHSCAVTDAGGVQCWGANNDGQLGDGSGVNQLQPVAVTGLPGAITTIAAGIAHSCGLTTANGVTCWGGNETGQLGDGTTTDRLAPVTVSGLAANVLSLQAGGYHTCVLVTGNRPLCWGRDSDGQLATGALTQHLTPLALAEPPPPQLLVNYTTAQTGSVLTLLGSGFAYSATVPLLANGVTVSDTLQVNPSGEFIVYVTTDTADQGAYLLQVGNPSQAAVSFLLQARAAIHPAEGSGIQIALPAGIGQPILDTYMPIVGK